MAQLKSETVSIRTSKEVKRLLRLAAEIEHRSVASMLEVLIRAYAKEHGLSERLALHEQFDRFAGSAAQERGDDGQGSS